MRAGGAVLVAQAIGEYHRLALVRRNIHKSVVITVIGRAKAVQVSVENYIPVFLVGGNAAVGDGAFRLKSEQKMRGVLSSGVTGILVSHSIQQVRSMCNKILWLDHGNQIAFTEEVQLYCDAYEEFLLTKKLPKTKDDIFALAQAHDERLEQERLEKQLKEQKRIEKVLEQGTSDAAIDAALNVIRKNRPELLNPEIFSENK